MKPFRRQLVIATLGTPALLLARRAGAAGRRLTPAQTEGPFYPVTIPADNDADLLANGALRYTRGQAVWVEGRLTDPDGRALAGAVVEIWQCDGEGRYHHPGDGDRADRAFQGFGRATVDRDGRWRFRTMKPVAYGGRTPHIHAKVKQGGRELLTTQLYVQGDPGNERDFLWRRLGAEDRAAITVPYLAGADGLKASYALVVAA
jgi:protocatechuate 3,4-dioxygenase beta subunit